MSKFICEANLLNSSQTILYNELKFHQYRNLLKCFLGDNLDYNSILINTISIIKDCTNLTETEIQKFSYIDFLLLLFQIRSTSLGNSVTLAIEIQDKQIKLHLNLDQVINHIHNILTTDLFLYKNENSYYFKLPSIEDILSTKTNSVNSIFFFLEKVNIKNTSITFSQFNYDEKEKIIQKLPLKNIVIINNHIKNILNKINDLNFLFPFCNKDFNEKVSIIPDLESIAFLIKLIFNNNLSLVYETMFVLSKYANMSGEFLDNCTPGEFFYFSKKFEELNSQNSKKHQIYQHSNLPPINDDGSLFDME